MNHPYYGPLFDAEAREIGQVYDINGQPVDFGAAPNPAHRRRSRIAALRAEMETDVRRVAELRAASAARQRTPPPSTAAEPVPRPKPRLGLPRLDADFHGRSVPVTGDPSLILRTWRGNNWTERP